MWVNRKEKMHKYIFVNSTEKVRKRPTEETKFIKCLKSAKNERIDCRVVLGRFVYEVSLYDQWLYGKIYAVYTSALSEASRNAWHVFSLDVANRDFCQKKRKNVCRPNFLCYFCRQKWADWGMKPSVARVTFCAMSHKINNLTTIWWPTYPTSFLAFIFTLPNKRSGMSRANINDI